MTPIKEVVRIKECIREQVLCQEEYADEMGENGAFICLSYLRSYRDFPWEGISDELSLAVV